MSTDSEPVEQFVRDAESVFDEYDKGYVNADVALDLLRSHLDTLTDSIE